MVTIGKKKLCLFRKVKYIKNNFIKSKPEKLYYNFIIVILLPMEIAMESIFHGSSKEDFCNEISLEILINISITFRIGKLNECRD